MADRLDLPSRHRRTLEALLREHLPDVEVWAYGSRVNGRCHAGSDLDLVLRKPGLKKIRAEQLVDFADAVCESAIPFLVEARDWARLPDAFRREIEGDYAVLVQRLADDTRSTTLGDYFTLQRGTTYKSRLLGQAGPVLLGLASIHRNGGFRAGNLRTYGGDCPEKLLVYPGELYVSLKDVTQSADLLGAVAKFPESRLPGRLTQDTVKLEPKHDDVPINYIHWLLRTPQYRYYCHAHATGTTNLGLPRDDFLTYPVPPLTPARCRLVEMLDALDDKIELNRRMNETLEAMARALFKSWFVDFEPVRAKVDGAEVGLPHEVSQLFPDGYENSALGKVPRGWKVVELAELIDVNPRRPSLRKGESAPYVPMSSMPTSGHTPSEVSGRPFGSGTRFINGDTLVARITPCLENGKTAYVDFLKEGQVGWGSTEYIVLRPKPILPSEFAYRLARSLAFRDFAIQSMTGTSGRQRVQSTALGQFLLPHPPQQIGKEFGRLIRPMIARAHMSAIESRTLAEMRDAILPRLISGEIRVQHAEQVLAAIR